MKNNYGQVTKGIVIEINETSDRVKLRIPVFHGPPSLVNLPEEAEKYWTNDDSLPWAEVMYPFGSEGQTLSSMMRVGEVVYVIFTSSSYRHPLVIGTTGKFV